MAKIGGAKVYRGLRANQFRVRFLVGASLTLGLTLVELSLENQKFLLVRNIATEAMNSGESH